MSTTPRNLPRFVPTLTEVVDPANLHTFAIKRKPDVEAVIERVRQQIQPIFERRLQEESDRLVRSIVAKQLAEIGAQLKEEMDMFIRQAVIDEINSQNFLQSQK